MHWLIAEDSLVGRAGHWVEYLGTFRRELRQIGDEVTFLVDRHAEPFILEQFEAQPVMPRGIFLRMGDGSGALRRYARVPVHGWRTWRAMARWLRAHPAPDLIFVPTVIVHHLVGWHRLIKSTLHGTRTRVLLFFPNTPLSLDADGRPRWDAAPTAKLFNRLIRSLRPEVESGRVVLGAETHPMREALSALTGVAFTYLPHPVALDETAGARPAAHGGGDIVMGSYGSARHEKGLDVLVPAIERHLAAHPDTRARFVLQVVGAFTDAWKRLQGHPRVEIVPGYFPPGGGYARQLAQTDVLLLPYRRSSYAVRVSRVVIEALVSGFPVVATDATTLADQVREFGAGVFSRDEDPDSLAAAIRDMEMRHDILRAEALARQSAAREHFSVRWFRDRVAGAH